MRAKDFLKEAIPPAPTAAAPAAPIAAPKPGAFTVDVPKGNRGVEVADMQKALVALGYPLPKFGVDGIRGRETSAAVRKFQQDNQLKIDGVPGTDTIAKMNTLLAAQPDVAAKLKKSLPSEVKAKGPAKLPPLSQDSITQGKVGEILNLVAGPESRGHYDMMYGSKRQPEILKMTINDANRFQVEWHKQMGSSAMGRYQIMAKNLIPYANKAGLDPATELFSPANQDKMAIVFLQEKGLNKWLEGQISDDQFLEGLSQVWAGVPSPSKGGRSYYGGVGLNKAKTQLAMDTALDSLQNIKGTGTATA